MTIWFKDGGTAEVGARSGPEGLYGVLGPREGELLISAEPD